MRKSILGAALSAILPGAALAQSSAPWSGVYIGIGVGGEKFLERTESAFGSYEGDVGTGWLGSVVVGYDHQFGSLVLGAFAEHGRHSTVETVEWTWSGGGRSAYGKDASWSAAARAGVLVTPSTLWYVPLGLTYSKFSSENSATGWSSKKEWGGLFAGLGAETMLADNISLRTEYRFTQYQGHVFEGSTSPFIARRTTTPNDQSGRLVAAYRFGGAKPAAEEPARAQPWTGIYLGGGLGYGIFGARNEAQYWFGTVKDDASGGQGLLGSAMAGFDLRLVPWLVAGAFAEYDVSRASLTSEGMDFAGGWSKFSFDKGDTMSLGARVGVLATPGTLWYVPLGHSWTSFSNNRFFGNGTATYLYEKHRFEGWFSGLGVETQLGSGWSVRGEYRFTQYDSKCVTCPGLVESSITPSDQTARAILSYKLGTGAD